MRADGIGDQTIVDEAKKVAADAADAPYTWGGHTTAGFDCSGFVIYVLKRAYPDKNFTFITAGQIFGDSRFEAVTTPQPGDLICFRAGHGTPHDHVGIVLDAGRWIGAQSSTGVKAVAFTNPYWSSKRHFFLRLKP